MNLEPQHPSLKQFRGTAVHAALAGYYGGQPMQDAVRIYDEMMASFPVTEASMSDYEKEKPLWRARLEQYPSYYPQENFDVVMVPEQELQVPVGSEGDQLLVRVDLIIRRRDTKAVYAVDHKTASKTGPSYASQFFVDLQGTSYVYAVQKALGEPCQGWITNVLKSTKDGWYERYQALRTKEQIESFERQTIARLAREKKAVECEGGVAAAPLSNPHIAYLDEHYPQYTHQCYQYGACAFLGLCHAGQAALPLFKTRDKDYVDEAD